MKLPVVLVGKLWQRNQDFGRLVANEVIDIQEALTCSRFDRERLIEAMVEAFQADPEHKCMGRSAPARLARALEHGKRLGLVLPTLTNLQHHAG